MNATTQTLLVIFLGASSGLPFAQHACASEPGPKGDETIRLLRAENAMLKAALETRNKRVAVLEAQLEAQLKEAEAQLEEARKPKPLEQDIARLKSRVAELEKENVTLRTTQRALADLNKKGEGVKIVPVVGDETPLLKLKANPRDYIRKEFIVAGALRVQDYYNYGYSEAKDTHVSLRLQEVRPNGSYTGEDISLYLSRPVSKELVEAVTKTVAGGYGAKLVRVKVTILGRRYDEGASMMGELLDWQFVNAERTAWQPWALGGNTPGPTPRR